MDLPELDSRLVYAVQMVVLPGVTEFTDDQERKLLSFLHGPCREEGNEYSCRILKDLDCTIEDIEITKKFLKANRK